MNTTENTKLIAEFKNEDFEIKGGGAAYIGDFLDDSLYKEHFECYGLFFFYEDMEFHSSWDWLMPVIEKIESKLDLIYQARKLNNQSNIKWLNCKEIIEQREITVHIRTHRRGLSLMIEPTQSNVYNFAIQFINWYNENK